MDHSPDQPAVEPHAFARRVPGALGAFVPPGRGAAPAAQTPQALNERGYDGWLVLEQDTAITADEPAVTSASMLAATDSIAFPNSAHTTEEINR